MRNLFDNKESRYLFVQLVLMVLLFGATFSGPAHTLSRKEIAAMKKDFTLHYRRSPDLWPVVAGMRDDHTGIFPVPVDNAVGTNSLNNAITLLRFNGDRLDYDELRRDFIEGVGSGDKYYPGLFSDEWIAYTQTRGFLLFNIRTKEGVEYLPIVSGDEYYTGVQTFDGSKLQFVFQKKEAFWPDGIRKLQLLEFHADSTFDSIAEITAGAHKIGYVEPFAVWNRTLFVYHNDSTVIRAYDMHFREVRHPFCDLFNRQEHFKRLEQLVFHPTLPLALLVEIEQRGRGNCTVWLACWENSDPDRRFIRLPREVLSPFAQWPGVNRFKCADFQFSPDGRWLLFSDDSESHRSGRHNPQFMAVPVDGTRALPLGVPKLLGCVLREYAFPTSSAWIREPLSFVVSDDRVLYKWELDRLSREFEDTRR